MAGPRPAPNRKEHAIAQQSRTRIAVVGGGIAGVAATYFLAQSAEAGARIDVTLFEATRRLGGIVETVHEGGFTIECGPDAWVTEKPWARELAAELGLAHDLLPSNDATRKTYILLNGRLTAMPDGMRMMVPTSLESIESSNLFGDAGRAAYRAEIHRAAELKASAPAHDESVSSFVRRHFGPEILTRLAAPLLSGVFGGDVDTLSAHAVLPTFVAMEREYGSLILGLQARSRQSPQPVFTTLRHGMDGLIDRMVAAIPPSSVRLAEPIRAIARTGPRFTLTTAAGTSTCDHLILATPPRVTRALLTPLDPEAAALLHMETSSALVVALGYATFFPLPPGFGFLIPPGTGSLLLACTFTDEKFPHRAPPGTRLLRAFFAGTAADRLTSCGNDEIASIARMELARILGPLPEPIITVVRRWPDALPQYAVGHLDRVAALEHRVRAHGNLTLLGSAYRGVGIPDLIREARAAARALLDHAPSPP